MNEQLALFACFYAGIGALLTLGTIGLLFFTEWLRNGLDEFVQQVRRKYKNDRDFALFLRLKRIRKIRKQKRLEAKDDRSIG